MKTLEHIREHVCVCVPTRSKCKCNILTDSIEQLIHNTEQHGKERLVDCSERFKQARKTFATAVGTNTLDKFVKQTKHHIAASGVDDQEAVRYTAGKEQCETDDVKLEQIKCDFKAKKSEGTEKLQLHNNVPRQFDDNEEKAHS